MTQAAPVEGFQVMDNKLIAASTEPVLDQDTHEPCCCLHFGLSET